MEMNSKDLLLMDEMIDWLDARADEYEEKSAAFDDELEDGEGYMIFSDIEDEAEEYVNDIFDYLKDRIPYFVEKGYLQAAFETVVDAYTQVDLEGMDTLSSDVYSNIMDLLELPVKASDDITEKVNMFLYIKEDLDDDNIPDSMVMVMLDVLHDLFDDKKILEILARIYSAQYEYCSEDDMPFIRARMYDVVERMGWPSEFSAELDAMEEADCELSTMLYAECLSRRGDRRVLEVWNDLLIELDSEDELSPAVDLIKYQRSQFVDVWGTEEDKEKYHEDYFFDEDDYEDADDEDYEEF